MQQTSFTVKAYTKTQLAGFYGVSLTSFKRWLKNVKDLGEYLGKCFTPAQVQKIVDHLGTP
jgi:hypothetical protein